MSAILRRHSSWSSKAWLSRPEIAQLLRRQILKFPEEMLRSVSEPSLGTVGTGTARSATSRADIRQPKKLTDFQRGSFLFTGRWRKMTLKIVLAPWNIIWQSIVLLTVIHNYLVEFHLIYFGDVTQWEMFYLAMYFCDFVFLIDVVIHFLHAFWPVLRVNIRVYRRNWFFFGYDVLSLVPICLISSFIDGWDMMISIGMAIGIIRIYRIFPFFWHINESMHQSRKVLFILEHMASVLLILHGGACFWYGAKKQIIDKSDYHNLGYPYHIGAELLRFDCYLNCWYYCACRLFNVIFGDAFPGIGTERWLTSVLTLVGFVFIRYRFIGTLAWDLVVENTRRLTFVDQYHHMIRYLKFHNAPSWLVEQSKEYKMQLWNMKDGVLTSNHLQELPLSLRMELIFDINVAHFHKTLLFRDTGEAFMRHISLLMHHEIYLAGQHIWTQGIVKNGMICVKRGVIEMLSDEDDESPMISFKNGTVLGELSLFYSIPAKVTVKAATYVELQVLPRIDFMRAMLEQTVMHPKIREKILKRLNKAKKRVTAIQEYDKSDSRLIRTRYRPMRVLKDHLAGVEAEDPTFVDDSHMYYRDENNVRQPKFTPEYLELYELSNNVTTIETPRICLRSTFPWILEPDTDFTYLFDLIHFFTVLYLCIMTPYTAIFASNVYNWEIVLNVVVKAGLLFNIYVQLTTAIIYKNVRKETVSEIAEVKMSTLGFYLDLISVSPIYIFSDTMDPQGLTAVGQYMQLGPILQVWHLWDYMKKWEKSFYNNAKILCLVKFSIFFLILCYWSGCFMYLMSCPRKLCKQNSWMRQLMYWETRILVTKQPKHTKATITSLSFGTIIFTGAGTSEMGPGESDILVVVLIFMLGCYLSCFYTAKICSIYMLATQRRTKFKESMRELFYFLTVNHVSQKIKDRVKKFFCVQWFVNCFVKKYYNNAVSTEELFRDMSTNIQQEVRSIETVDTLIFCPLFQECSRDFLQTVAANTRTIVLPDNEVVQHAADIGRDMYILQKGHCNLLNHMGKVIKSVGPGKCFGVMEMLFGLPKVYTVLTTTNCILLNVEYSALVQCLSTFPDVRHPIEVVLDDPLVLSRANYFDEAKPLTGRLDAKTNRIAQELKESFVVVSGSQEREQYVRTFDKLGIMRYVRFIILPGVITPHGMFLKIWCFIRFIVAGYYVLLIPYCIATTQHKLGLRTEWLDIFLYLDIVVMAYVAYYNEKSLLVTHPWLTMKHYLKHAFLLDFITVFPFEEILKIMNDNVDLDYYRMNRVLQVTRIIGAFSYLESNIMSMSSALVLIKYLPLALTAVNFVTSFIFVNSCKPFRPANEFFVQVNCTKSIMITSIKYHINFAMIEYFSTFFWLLEMFVGCGCVPILVSNDSDVWMVMLIQVFGFMYFAFMFGYIASTRSAAAQSLLDHTEKTKDLSNFLYQENVDPMLTAKTMKYFEYVWKRTNGSNPQQICRRLNSALMEDTLVFMYEKTLREVPLFSNVERSFIRVITQYLKEMYFLKGETVIQCRDIQPYIYIIYRGKVDVLSSYNEMITCMGPGGMFGNFTGQPISSSTVSIFASRSLDLLVIPSQTFFNLVKYYPKIQEPLNKAFEMSKDYILPISVGFEEDDESLSANYTSPESYSDAEGSNFDSTTSANRFLAFGEGPLGNRSSQSDLSQAKSLTSIVTNQSFSLINLYRPGTMIFQSFGYFACMIVTINYVLILYDMVTLNPCYILYWFHGLCDIFFFLKIFFSMHQGYICKSGELIMDANKCRRRYFRQTLTLWTDIFANIPLESLAFAFPDPIKAMHYLRGNKLLRVKYLVEFYKKTSAELTNNLTILQAVMTAAIVVMLIHSFTCIWLVVLTATTPFCNIRTMKEHLISESTKNKSWDYTTSFYVMVSELTATGGDEFVLDNPYSMAILGFAIIAGKILAAIVVATSMQVAYSTKHALVKYEKANTELIDVLKNQGLSEYQLKKFCKYVQQLWVTERGRQLPALLAQTPYGRRCDLMSAMFGVHLRGSYLFSDTGEPFLRQLTAVLEYTVFYPGNYIVVAGDSEARMHWVSAGTVSVVSVRSDLTETTHELLGPGDVFGIMQGLNRGVAHCFSYRAETKVGIITLALDSWINILHFFPEARKTIIERSEKLFARI